MKDFIKKILGEPLFAGIAPFLILGLMFVVLPAYLVSKVSGISISKKIIQEGPMKGEKKLDLLKCLLICIVFWAFLYYILTSGPSLLKLSPNK